MPRRQHSATTLIVNYFMQASLPEAKQALETAKAIVSSREAIGIQQPELPARPARPRRARRPRQDALPGTTTATTTPPATAAEAPKPRARRSRRPAVDAAPGPVAVAPTPLPDQTVAE